MRCKKLILSVLFMFGGVQVGLQAQENITTTGGEASGSGGVVSYSVGQVAYTTYTGTGGSVAQGVQQAFEIFVLLSNEEAKDIHLKCSAYPNPVTDYLILDVDNNKERELSYLLFDVNGKLLKKEKVSDNKTRILMADLVPSTYFLKVINGNQEVKTFKIIKN